jgi:SecD/SecF fusion protein
MQNKSFVWVFTTLLSIACLYQLSFSWVASSVEKEATVVAQRKLDSVKTVQGEIPYQVEDSLYAAFESEYLLNMQSKEVYPLLGFDYRTVKKQQINLGLDLQGGMNVTLEVSVVDVIRALSGYSKDETFNQAIANAIQAQKTSQENFVTLFSKAFTTIDPNAKLAAIFHTRENKEKFPREATNQEVLDIISQEAEDAIKRTEQVIRKRIDNLGVVQPKIQRLDRTGRILVELPGVRNKERVRTILQGTAKLEFWETFENAELYPKLAEANELLSKKLSTTVKNGNADTLVSEVKTDSTAVSKSEDLLSQLEGESTDSTQAAASSDTESFEDFAKKNPLFGTLRPFIVQNQDGNYYPGKGPVVGYAALKDTAKVMAYLNRKDVKALLPPRIKFFWDAKPYDTKGEFLQLFAINVTNRDGFAPLEGDVITDARKSADPLGNPEVTMAMNAEGAKTWKNLTKENIGKSIAIVLDNLVYSAPNVQSEISGGRSSISGRFTVEESEDLANVLKAGKLPAPARIIEEAVVGPSLGQEAIDAGLRSFMFALIIILAYMMFYYAKAGVASNLALIANLFFVMGVLASISATLTLPGIAGIVLTIGMSVDANVLIYERIREELTQGKGIKLAIADGYKNAYSSIIDANITTLLTGIVLLVFGSGPIKGFATTLIIGILTSLFSAIFITRLIMEWYLERKSDVTFSTKLTEGAFKNMNFSFVGKRKMFYVISGIIIIAGLGSFMTRGFDQGVDFTGGRTYQVRFENQADINAIRTELADAFIEDNLKQAPEVKIFGSSNQVKITTKFMIDNLDENSEEIVETALRAGLDKIGSSYEIMSSQKVGPTIADDLKSDAMLSIIFALLIIFLYILFRFRKWQFGLGALVAMIHDVLIVLSIFSLFYGILPFSLEIDQAFIAAILTVVGYSINDTVVVFDRVREYLENHKKKSVKDIMDGALNSTISRTINTSLSTFFVLLMIFIFGGEVIRGFVFALMIGIVVGTYSSLCIASPLVVDLDKKKEEL